MFPEDDDLMTPRIWKAFNKALARYGHRPDVTGIDVGFKITAGRATKTLAIRIHVREKHGLRNLGGKERLPKAIDRVPVDVIEAVYAGHEALAPEPARVDAASTLRPGVSISHVDGPSGTLGTFVNDQSGARYLLGAAHVLAGSSTPRPGDPIVQPARDDGGGPAARVATLDRLDRDTDAALARLDGTRPEDPAAVGSGIAITSARYPRIGNVLEKSGRSTGVTRALVDGIGQYQGLLYACRLVPVDDTRPVLSRPGDSGAIWYDPATGAGVALHCKGEANPNAFREYALATSLKMILSALRVDF